MSKAINDSTKILTEYYKAATSKLMAVILSSDTYTLSEKARIISRMGVISKRLNKQTTKWANVYFHRAYKIGGKESIKLLATVGRPAKQVMGRMEKEALTSLVDGTIATFGEAISGVGRSGIQVLDSATKERIRTHLSGGVINSKTIKEIKKGIVAELEGSFTVLKDRGGRKWSLENYSEMLARTKLTEATNLGTQMTLMSSGYNLAMVTSHNTACPLCKPWEGKVVSLDGSSGVTAGGVEYVPIEDAYATGLWHPNCMHRTVPYHEDIHDKAVKWSAGLQRYV